MQGFAYMYSIFLILEMSRLRVNSLRMFQVQSLYPVHSEQGYNDYWKITVIVVSLKYHVCPEAFSFFVLE